MKINLKRKLIFSEEENTFQTPKLEGGVIVLKREEIWISQEVKKTMTGRRASHQVRKSE